MIFPKISHKIYLSKKRCKKHRFSLFYGSKGSNHFLAKNFFFIFFKKKHTNVAFFKATLTLISQIRVLVPWINRYIYNKKNKNFLLVKFAYVLTAFTVYRNLH